MKTFFEVLVDNQLIPCCRNCANGKYERQVSGEVKLVCRGVHRNGFEKCEGWRGI